MRHCCKCKTYTASGTGNTYSYEDLTKSSTRARPEPDILPPTGRGRVEQGYGVQDAKYAVLLGQYIGTIDGVLLWKIPSELRQLLEGTREKLKNMPYREPIK